MVNNNFEILDEGIVKKLSKHDLYNEMKKPIYYYDFEREVFSMNLCFEKKELAGKHLQEQVIKRHDRKHDHDNYNELIAKCNDYKKNEILYSFLWDKNIIVCDYNTHKICKYYNITPFTPSVMINISPNWQNLKRSNANKITILKTIFENYLKEEWYDNWEYVIENGSDGNHIHLHAVCHINQKRYKSCITHLSKNHHVRQLSKYAKKLGGLGGIESTLINGKGIQKNIIRCEKMLKDKLLYLHEETKPEGHKNKSVVENGYVKGCL